MNSETAGEVTAVDQVLVVYMSLCGLFPPTEVRVNQPTCESAKLEYMHAVETAKIPAALACKADGVVGSADFGIRYSTLIARKLPMVAPVPCQ